MISAFCVYKKGGSMVTVDQIQKALDGIRPHLQADGGDVEFVSMSDDGVVSVRLKGACGSCPMALMTLKSGIEAQLKESYPDVKKVVSV
jgi:NifU-like protein